MRIRFAVAFALAMALGSGVGASGARAGLLSPDDQKIYRQAFVAAGESKFDYARALAAKASDKLLGRALTWMQYQRLGSGATFEQISGFVRDNPTWPLIPTLVRRAEEAITAATPIDLLRPWFGAYPPATAEGAMAWARVLQADGQPDKAAEVLRHAWIADSFGPLQERDFLAHFSPILRPEDDVARLDRLLWDHQDEAATAQMRRVDERHRRLARARMALEHDHARAEIAATNVDSADRHDPGLVYELMRYRRERGHEDDAIPLLQDPGADQGRPELWWAERAALARYSLQKGNAAQAFAIASVHGALDGQPLMEAEWLSGWIALRFLHDNAGAQERFSRLYDHAVTPIGKARGAYWAARACEAAGDQDKAKQWYERAAENVTAFYGQLAAARTDHDGIGPLPSDPLPTADDIGAFERDELVRVARMLGEVGQADLIRPFLLRLIDIERSPGVRAQAAALASSLGREEIAIAVAHHSERDGVPLIASGYPIPALPAADKVKPERALVLGLIRQESGFHHDAVSSAGARGLMQLMPATAIKLARAIKLVFKRTKTLDAALTRDPGLNLRLGTTYLAELLDQFNGSYILAVAAYNAGPARVEKWMHEFGDPRTSAVDAVDWIESIPFAETRNYVERVLEGVQVYRKRLGATGMQLSLENDLRR